jgi:hypothetical protein
MYKVNEPNNMLSHTYSGPARIMNIHKKRCNFKMFKNWGKF